jgi:hypothetical protein
MVRQITPFGTYEGYEVNTFSSFSAAAPNATVFEVPNQANCPAGGAAECGGGSAFGALGRFSGMRGVATLKRAATEHALPAGGAREMHAAYKAALRAARKQ